MPTYTARWVIPVDRPPLEWGLIDVEGERIASVQSGGESATSPPDGPVINLGNVAILPGLVNAHTHLEFSELEEPIPPGRSFADWIGRVVDCRRGRTDPKADIKQGLAESLASGTTTLGEIATSDAWRTLAASSGTGVVFRELIGLKPDRWEPALETAHRHLQEVPADVANWVRGLSPHAPYSVHPRLYERLMDLAVESGAPVAVHLAETREELELLEHGTGPLVKQLEQFGAWDDNFIPRGSRVLDYLIPLAEVDHGLVIHGNYLSDAEIDFLARQPTLSVVYCPRTHAAFGHAPHPWRRLMEAGIRVALGTDSRASNPDLSLWNEVRFLAESFPEVSAANLIRMATLNGAEALGCGTDVGSLKRDKLANMMVFKLDGNLTGDNSVERAVLQTPSLAGLMQAGRWVIEPGCELNLTE